MRAIVGVVVGICTLTKILIGSPASAADLKGLTLPNLPTDSYAGVGVGTIHHTGYIHNTPWNAEAWRPGVKVLGGVVVTSWLSVEGSYHYLSKATFREGFLQTSTEQSHAVSASVLLYSRSLTEWLPWLRWPVRFFARGGGAYKWIEHKSLSGTFDAGGFSYLLGGGVQIDFTRLIFFRVEIEYISKLQTGSTPSIDVQHTPISATLGVRF